MTKRETSKRLERADWLRRLDTTERAAEEAKQQQAEARKAQARIRAIEERATERERRETEAKVQKAEQEREWWAKWAERQQ